MIYPLVKFRAKKFPARETEYAHRDLEIYNWKRGENGGASDSYSIKEIWRNRFMQSGRSVCWGVWGGTPRVQELGSHAPQRTARHQALRSPCLLHRLVLFFSSFLSPYPTRLPSTTTSEHAAYTFGKFLQKIPTRSFLILL